MMIPSVQGSLSHLSPQNDGQLLYLMLKPTPEQAAVMDHLRTQYDLSRNYAAERFHITLLPFGDIRMRSQNDLMCICHAMASLQAEPFDVTLNRISGNALVGSRMRALRDFQRALLAQLNAFGIDIDYTFQPHASLTCQSWQRRNIPVPPISWRAEQFLLIESGNGRHVEHGRWPLIARQGVFDF
jgi:RNA 2',3'-cyclic 3'-phosphodiesterase